MQQDQDEQFQAVLDRLKEALRLPTNKAVAEALGLTASNLGERKTRGALPKEQIDQLCSKARLNPDWVYLGRGDVFVGGQRAKARMAQLKDATEVARQFGLPDDEAMELRDLLFQVAAGNREVVEPLVRKLQKVTVPRLHIQASAGSGSVISFADEAVVDVLAFDRSWLKSVGCDPLRSAVISVRGDSMEPLLENGDLILVDMRPTTERIDGVYVIAVGEAVKVKRLHFRANGTVEIRSDNKNYETDVLKPADFEHLHIVGRMVRRLVR